jgi:dolichyl-phosphate-mannose-protein mannosyltransferase
MQSAASSSAPAPAQRLAWATSPVLISALVAAKLLIHLLTFKGPGWGLFRDELYFIVCGWRLDWGYVDHPPLVPLLARVGDTLFGPFGIRIFPALAGAAMVALAALIARELGGGRFAQVLAGLSVICAPHYLGSQAKLATDSIEPLFWTLCCYVLVLIIKRDDPRLWPWFGLFAGLGLQTKHSTIFFGFAVVLALLLTPRRRLMWNRWFALAGVIAFLVFLPNMIWEVHNDRATLELLQNVKNSTKNIVLGPWQYFTAQIMGLHPVIFPIWLAGIAYFLFHPAGKRWRVFAFAYAVLFVLFVALRGKAYYLASYYPVLMAGGAVWAAQITAAGKLRSLRPVYLALLLISTAVISPLILTILSPEGTLAYQNTLGLKPRRSERSHTSELAQHFSDRLGWQEMVASVAAVHRSLPEAERQQAAIFAQNFGEAGAIDVYGKPQGLPPALSGHQNYFLWGTHGWQGDVLIVMDDSPGSLPELCKSVEDRGVIRSRPLAMPEEQRQHIFVCHGLKQPLANIWPQLKVWL